MGLTLDFMIGHLSFGSRSFCRSIEAVEESATISSPRKLQAGPGFRTEEPDEPVD